MSKRTPEEILKAIEEAATSAEDEAGADGADTSIDAEIQRVLAMSDAERRSELEAAGIDLVDLHAKTDAWIEGRPVPVQATFAPPPASHGSEGGRLAILRKPPAYLLFAAAFVLIGVAAAAVAFWSPSREPSPAPTPTAPAPSSTSVPGPDVAMIRRDAIDACTERRWEACLHGLDVAKGLDPAGDSEPRVMRARREAARALDGRDAAEKLQDKPVIMAPDGR